MSPTSKFVLVSFNQTTQPSTFISFSLISTFPLLGRQLFIHHHRVLDCLRSSTITHQLRCYITTRVTLPIHQSPVIAVYGPKIKQELFSQIKKPTNTVLRDRCSKTFRNLTNHFTFMFLTKNVIKFTAADAAVTTCNRFLQISNLWPNSSVDFVSVSLYDAGEQHITIVVRALPPRLSCRMRVNLLSRYGINPYIMADQTQ